MKTLNNIAGVLSILVCIVYIILCMQEVNWHWYDLTWSVATAIWALNFVLLNNQPCQNCEK